MYVHTIFIFFQYVMEKGIQYLVLLKISYLNMICLLMNVKNHLHALLQSMLLKKIKWNIISIIINRFQMKCAITHKNVYFQINQLKWNVQLTEIFMSSIIFHWQEPMQLCSRKNQQKMQNQ